MSDEQKSKRSPIKAAWQHFQSGRIKPHLPFNFDTNGQKIVHLLESLGKHNLSVDLESELIPSYRKLQRIRGEIKALGGEVRELTFQSNAALSKASTYVLGEFTRVFTKPQLLRLRRAQKKNLLINSEDVWGVLSYVGAIPMRPTEPEPGRRFWDKVVLIGTSSLVAYYLSTWTRFAMAVSAGYVNPAPVLVYAKAFFMTSSFNFLAMDAYVRFFSKKQARWSPKLTLLTMGFATEIGFSYPSAYAIAETMGQSDLWCVFGAFCAAAFSPTTILLWSSQVGPDLRKWRKRNRETKKERKTRMAEAKREKERMAAESKHVQAAYQEAEANREYVEGELELLKNEREQLEEKFNKALKPWRIQFERFVQEYEAEIRERGFEIEPHWIEAKPNGNCHKRLTRET